MAEVLVLVEHADGAVKKITLSEIASRTAPMSTMPPMGAILSDHELRNIVEYLSTLK